MEERRKNRRLALSSKLLIKRLDTDQPPKEVLETEEVAGDQPPEEILAPEERQ